MRMVLEEEDEQIEWGRQGLDALLAAPQGERSSSVAEWCTHLERYLAAARGVFGEELRQTEDLPARRSSDQPTQTTRTPRRDRRFLHVWQSRGVEPAADRPVQERLWWMMNVRLQEMHVSELVATVIADWRDQP